MLEPQRNSSGLRPGHALFVVGTVAVVAIVAFAAFSFVVGIVAFLVKLAIVFGVVYLAARFVLHRSRRSGT